MTDLASRRAFVTGGESGVGAAVALALAERGADVVLGYRRPGDCVAEILARIESLGRRSHAVEAKSGDPADVRRRVGEAAAWLGGLDILIHNAGAAPAASLDDMTPGDVDLFLRTSIRDTVLTTQAALPHMRAGGRIVMISADVGEHRSDQLSALQATIKAAHYGFTKGLARELESRGVTVNLIQPGPSDIDPADDHRGDLTQRLARQGSYRTVEDLAAVVAFVASSEAALMTGSIITARGGPSD